MIPKVTKWLEEQGFTLEMRTAACFRKAGFEVRQSSYYVDPESGKNREIDVIAFAPDKDRHGIIKIIFVVECKSSNKPWSLLCSPDVLVGHNIFPAFSVTSEKTFRMLCDLKVSELIKKWPWLKKNKLAAYSVRQAMSDSDVAYAAAISVTKASNFYVEQSMSYMFAFPIIVVNSPILQCTLDENVEIEVKEVTEGEWLFFANENFGNCIRVISIDRLPLFIEEALKLSNQICEDLKPEQEKVLESWKRQN